MLDDRLIGLGNQIIDYYVLIARGEDLSLWGDNPSTRVDGPTGIDGCERCYEVGQAFELWFALMLVIFSGTLLDVFLNSLFYLFSFSLGLHLQQ